MVQCKAKWHTDRILKHPTQGLATSRAYMVCDNYPWHISICKTPKWKDWPPIKLQFSRLATSTHSPPVTHKYSLLGQLSWFCHCIATVFFTETSRECLSIPRGAQKRKDWWQAWEKLRSSSLLFLGLKVCLSLSIDGILGESKAWANIHER